MKWKKYLILVVGFGLLSLSACGDLDDSARQAEGAKVFQKLTFAEALAQAKQENKVVMVDFGTKDCVYCQQMDAKTFSDATVQKFLAKEVIPIKVDARAERELADQYDVEVYPTFVFVDPTGKVVGRIERFHPPAEFLKEAVAFAGKG